MIHHISKMQFEVAFVFVTNHLQDEADGKELNAGNCKKATDDEGRKTCDKTGLEVFVEDRKEKAQR